MPKKKDAGLKGGEKQPQSGNDQPDKKAPGPQAEPLEDGRVALSQEEFEKLRSDLDNYREATLSLKKKMKELSGSEPESEPDSEPATKSDTGGGVTKWDLARRDFFRDHPEMRKHEGDMMAYYRRIDSADTIEAKISNLERAGRLYRLDNPKKFKGRDKEDEKAKTKLSSESGEPTGKTKPSEGEPEKPGERKILKTGGTSPDEWYPGEE